MGQDGLRGNFSQWWVHGMAFCQIELTGLWDASVLPLVDGREKAAEEERVEGKVVDGLCVGRPRLISVYSGRWWMRQGVP